MDNLYRRDMKFRFARELRDDAELRARVDFIAGDRITEIDLADNPITDDGPIVDLLKKMRDPSQAACESINLSGTQISNGSIEQIGKLLGDDVKALRSLRLSNTRNVNWNNAITHLSVPARLTALDVSENAIGSSICPLLSSLKDNPHIRHVDLHNVGLPQEALGFLQFPQADSLRIGGNACDLSAIAWSEFTCLRRLNLNRITNGGTLAWLAVLNSLTSLDLTKAALSMEACENIAAAVKKATVLDDLRLDGCLTNPTWQRIVVAGVVENKSISGTLSISHNQLSQTLDAWKQLCPRLLTISRVDVEDCGLESAHLEELVRTVYECHQPPFVGVRLRDISLSQNMFRDEASDWVGELIQFPFVEVFRAGGNGIADGTPIYEALLQATRSKRNLKAEVAGGGPQANRFNRAQHAWLVERGFAKPGADGFNTGALPFVPGRSVLPAAGPTVSAPLALPPGVPRPFGSRPAPPKPFS